MNEFSNMLQSPAWWISVVLVSLVVNVASSYIKDAIDKAGIGFIKHWTIRSNKKKTEIELKVQNLKDDKHAQLLFAAYASRCTLYLIYTQVQIVFLTLILFSESKLLLGAPGKVFFLILGAVFFGLIALSFAQFQVWWRAQEIMHRAKISSGI